MTEQTPQDETREKQKHEPRDAAFWAQRIERLEVSDVPEGAANVNVQGRREVGALQGFVQPRLSLMITPVHAASATPGNVSHLCSETHSEGQIGYREWVRRNGRLDDRYDHDVDELMA